jgi:hypothetical protein
VLKTEKTRKVIEQKQHKQHTGSAMSSSGGANKRARRHGMTGSAGVESEVDSGVQQQAMNATLEDDEMASVSSASTALTTFSGEDERKRELVRLMTQCMHDMGYQCVSVFKIEFSTLTENHFFLFTFLRSFGFFSFFLSFFLQSSRNCT